METGYKYFLYTQPRILRKMPDTGSQKAVAEAQSMHQGNLIPEVATDAGHCPATGCRQGFSIVLRAAELSRQRIDNLADEHDKEVDARLVALAAAGVQRR